MNQPSNDTAVLIFSRSAANEAAHKGYARLAGKKGGDSLAASLIQKTVSAAYDSRLPVLTHFDQQQQGDTLGERLANAIEQSFTAGYSKLIVVGTDCPTLTASMLNSAAVQLQRKSLVLGPSLDGGIYLLGISKAAYERQQFLQLPWLSATLFNAWKDYACQACLSVAIESTATDLDDAAGFQQWLSHAPAHPLSLFFTEIIARWKRLGFLPPTLLFPPFFAPASFFLRGPPTTA